ncbi:retinal pigment epithelial membrane protein-domain-containing protein [Haematococcus lacustris]
MYLNIRRASSRKAQQLLQLRKHLPLKVLVPLAGAMYVWKRRRHIVSSLYDMLVVDVSGEDNTFLSGNFGPVDEESTDADLPVDGTLPLELKGIFMRNGPNPYFKPQGSYHWFDGDGMVHGVRMKNGQASYANRFIRTERLQQEMAAKRPLFLKVGDMCGKRGLLLLLLDSLKSAMGIIRADQGNGTANTALVFHAKKLLALTETDLPYHMKVLCDGVLETVGRLTPKDGNAAYPGPFTAHPKLDPKTGEMFFFGYNFVKKPYFRAGMMSATGDLTKQWAIDVPFPVMAHDCAMTENYVVLLHLPLCFDPEHMMHGNNLPVVFRADKRARIGLLRRDAPGCNCDVEHPNAKPAPVQWIELPAFFAFHTANAWEDEDGRVHLVLCTYPKFAFEFEKKDGSGFCDEEKQRLVKYVLDPATGGYSSHQMSGVHCDFPMVNPAHACYTTRFTWGATWDFVGIAKYDLSTPAGTDACVAEISFPPGCQGGEAFFTPRYDNPQKCDGEDDGFLLVYVYDPTLDTSTMNVYDAKTMDPEPLARVRLPRRVPHGFHTLFVTEKQLKTQPGWRRVRMDVGDGPERSRPSIGLVGALMSRISGTSNGLLRTRASVGNALRTRTSVLSSGPERSRASSFFHGPSGPERSRGSMMFNGPERSRGSVLFNGPERSQPSVMSHGFDRSAASAAVLGPRPSLHFAEHMPTLRYLSSIAYPESKKAEKH